MMSSGTTATVESGGEGFPCIYTVHYTLDFQYPKRTSCLLGADLAGCGNDDANYGRQSLPSRQALPSLGGRCALLFEWDQAAK